ncbi:GNAT family N-acetyltransferase [Virgibacillus sp. MSP4-1]|uniref:GNAT family N-acetyltransferase n=1 Tax=Virgibacillus sp. MSP4-1 TaxID=2700081 RepID=UPI0003A7E8AB|nr:GNAT family protein [Virgibacillus sp. MSP4-1]QHS21761.1 GNAT family N-acetyltransferase [Virgibacillus sp. MSP4-1]
MIYEFKPMTQEQAEQIAYNWHYEGVYSFYDTKADKEDMEEFPDSEQRGESMFAVTGNDELTGFFSINQVNHDTIDIGLGLHPDITGKGYGLTFLREGLNFAEKKYHPGMITLSVATLNQRAMKVYKRAGFTEAGTFIQNTNGGPYEFLRMVYKP